MRDGLIFAHSALIGIGLRDKVRIIAAGKIITAFHMFRTIALGADMCNSARGMMFALGCIQARRCNCNTCPVGIATQDPSRVKGLDVNRKAPRVARYHSSTIKSFLEILSAAGLQDASEIRPKHVLRRTDTATIKHLDEIYPVLPKGCLLVPNGIPESWRGRWQRAAADHW
jgi:glutamate synthase domain-containing protein 2